MSDATVHSIHEHVAAQQELDNLTDISDDKLAMRFATAYKDKLRITPSAGTWHIWDGSRWKIDATNLAQYYCRLFLRKVAAKRFKSIYMELYKPDPQNDSPNSRAKKRREAKSKAIKSVRPLKSDATCGAVLHMARSDPQLTIIPEDWDGKHVEMLLNTPDGTIDLHSGVMRQAQQDHLITKCTRISPLLQPTPYWESYLDHVTKGNVEFRSYLKRLTGYCLTGNTKERALFFCHGPTSTGKSTISHIISFILNDYACNAAEGTFMINKSERHTQELARLAGIRFVTSHETDEESTWKQSRLKNLTGGTDKITARFMRQNDIEFMPQLKLFIFGNKKPSLTSVDDAIRIRFHLLPFINRIQRIDRAFDPKIEAEAPGILHWMIEGCLEWQQQGLNPPSYVREATDNYLDEEDNMRSWLTDSCVIHSDLWTGTTDLFNSFRRWCKNNDTVASSKRIFSVELDNRSEEFGIRKARRRSGAGFSHIALISTTETDE